MNKKFISSVLAGACALSMTSIAAFAVDTDLETLGADGYASQQVTVTSETKMPTIKVTVPTAADLVVNPYKLTVGTPASSDTIISPEYTITNASDCGITVSATVKATPAGAAAVATAPLKGTETTKSVFMYLETTETSDTYYEGGYVAKEVKPARGAELTDEQKAANAACKAQMVITTKDTTKDIATLGAGNTTAQSIYFKVQGDAVTAPKTPWLAADKVDLALTLKITPNANAETSAGGPASTWTATGTTAAMTLSSSAGTFANTSGNNYTWTLVAADAAAAGLITPTLNLDSGWSVSTATVSGRALDTTVNTTTGAFTIDNRSANGDTGKVTITITDGSDNEDIVIDITVIA